MLRRMPGNHRGARLMRFLFAWEQGGNLGHLSKLLLIARQMRNRGHEILFAVKDVGTARQLLEGEGFSFVQCPLAVGVRRARREPTSFADILVEAGFAEQTILSGLIHDWQTLFDTYRPAVLLAQYAPASLIAARLAGLPSLKVDIAFESPPAVSPFPSFRPWLRLSKEELLKTETVIVANINGIRQKRGAAPHEKLHQALAGDVSLLATLPELDHYPGRRGGRYIGPLFVDNDGDELFWSDRNVPHIFLYLRPFPGLEKILKTLDQSGADVLAFVPGIGEELKNAFTGGSLRISSSRLKLNTLLPQMDVAINHANHGTVAATQLAGVPMLAIPGTIEQWMTSRNLEQMGTAIGMRTDKVELEFEASLKKVLSDTTYRKNARDFAAKYAGYDQELVVMRLANTLEKMTSMQRKEPLP